MFISIWRVREIIFQSFSRNNCYLKNNGNNQVNRFAFAPKIMFTSIKPHPESHSNHFHWLQFQFSFFPLFTFPLKKQQQQLKLQKKRVKYFIPFIMFIMFINGWSANIISTSKLICQTIEKWQFNWNMEMKETKRWKHWIIKFINSFSYSFLPITMKLIWEFHVN